MGHPAEKLDLQLDPSSQPTRQHSDEALTEEQRKLVAMTEEAWNDEEGIARIAAWYEAQPAAWIAEMDAIGRTGPLSPPRS